MTSEMERSPKNWPPLGMPTGSVRALLTLIIVAVVVVNVARGGDLGVLWVETLLMALAHYFTSRRFVALPRDVLQRLERGGVIEQERHPLFLPRHTIRLVIILSFVGLAAYLYREHRLWETRALTLLSMVFAYLLGTLVRGIVSWFSRKLNHTPARFWGDARALIVLAGVAIAAVPELVGMAHVLPDSVIKLALGLLLFYFGSR